MNKPNLLLIIEDDIGLRKQLRWSFDRYEIVMASDRCEAINAVKRYSPSVVTLDLGLPPDPTNASEGLTTLKEILVLAPATKIIVVTGNNDHNNATQALAFGAYDFYQKPIDPELLGLIIDKAFQSVSPESDDQLQDQSCDTVITDVNPTS